MINQSDGRMEVKANDTWAAMFEWTYSGVDHTLPGNGGQECVDFLSLRQRVVESFFTSLIAVYVMWKGWQNLKFPRIPASDIKPDDAGKRFLLVLLCLVFGVELGFKFATRQVIYLLNPCHLATIIQIYLLAAPQGKLVTAVFRLHMHMLTGAPIAIIFPVVNTRLLPMETEVYYIQHILMLVVPFYLMKTGSVYIPEDLLDFSWASMSLGILYLYHFIPLQILAMASQVNLNNMLCPAISDPFHGLYYRLFAVCHQAILIPTLGKLFVSAAKILPVWRAHSKDRIVEEYIYSASSEAGCSYYVQDHVDTDLPRESENRFLDKSGNGVINGKVMSHTHDLSNGHLKAS